MVELSISRFQHPSQFTPAEVQSFEDLCTLVCTEWWSPGLFDGNHRTKATFLRSELIALDFDDGTLSLEDAKEAFHEYRHIIGTTKSHSTEHPKFRVILFLSAATTDAAVVTATYNSFQGQGFPVDPACKDASRFFYPCTEIVSVRVDGKLVDPVEPTAVAKPLEPVTFGDQPRRGLLSSSTVDFLFRGAKEGTWHHRLVKASIDMKEQGYSEEEAIEKFSGITGVLDEHDYHTIDDIYQNRDVKYPPRIPLVDLEQQEARDSLLVSPQDLLSTTKEYLNDKDLVKGEPTGLEGLDALFGGGKRLGEVTALCAEGKSGKNALYHYMMYLWLERGVPIGYASRELDPATEVIPDLLSMKFDSNARLEDFREEEYRDYLTNIPLYFAKGRGFFPLDEIEQWVAALKEREVQYIFMDHLHWMLADPEEWKDASLLSRNLKDMAVRHQVHIDLIIQPKILMEGQRPSLNSMKGGSAIGQNIDNLLTFERFRNSDEKHVSILTMKAKRSRLGSLGEIYLRYDPTVLKLSEVDRVDVEQQAPPSGWTPRMVQY